MELQEHHGPGNRIFAYEPGKIVVNETPYQQSLLLSLEQLEVMPDLTAIADISQALLERCIALQPEVFIIGTGDQPCLLLPEQQQILLQAKIGLEVMTTAAACRTYSLLQSDGRSVLAILIINKQPASTSGVSL